MYTRDFLQELERRNIRMPSSWAIVQSSSGVLLDIMPTYPKRDDILAQCKMIRKMLEEKIEKDI